MADESKKKTIIIYADWINKFEELDDDEAGRLIKHFFRYVNNLNPVAPDRITKISFIDIENSLKRNLEKYEKTVAGRSKAGKASVLARKLSKEQTLTNSTNVNYVEQTLTNLTDSDSDSDNDNDNDNDNKNKNKNEKENIAFEVFYNLYDKKVDCVKTKLKWDKLNFEVQKQILSVIPEYVKATPDKQFRKSPLVYLNNKSWLDEIVMPKSDMKPITVTPTIKINML